MPKLSSRTYLETDTVLKIVRAAGLHAKRQRVFYQVNAPEGRKLYVAKGKSVGRIDLSGFRMPAHTKGIVNLGEDEAFGRVTQQVDFERSHDDVIETIKAVVAAAKGTVAVAAKKAGKKAAKQQAATA